MKISMKHIAFTWIGAVVLMLLLFPYKAYNISNPVTTISSLTNTEVSNISVACDSINMAIYLDSDNTGINKVSTFMLLATKDSSTNTNGELIVNIEFNATVYNKLKQEQKQAVMEHILTGIDNYELSQISRTKIYNFVTKNDEATASLVRQLSGDVKADFASAYNSFRPFTGVIGWILGVLTMLIFMLLGITIVIDMAYLTLPIFQNWLSNENSSVKPNYISTEAWNAIKAAEDSIGSGYREPIALYMKFKTKQFLAIGLCLLYLVSGQIYELLAVIMDSFAEFIK